MKNKKPPPAHKRSGGIDVDGEKLLHQDRRSHGGEANDLTTHDEWNGQSEENPEQALIARKLAAKIYFVLVRHTGVGECGYVCVLL